MSDNLEKDPMIEMYVHETNNLIEQLENRIIESEKEGSLGEAINEIFRVMHTIKGNSMMMQYNGIANTAHALEDLFDYLRTYNPTSVNYNAITDLVLEAVDYFKFEIAKIGNDQELIENEELKERIREQLESLRFVNYTEENALRPLDDSEVDKVANLSTPEVQPTGVVDDVDLKYYSGTLFYEAGTQMVNVRAYSIVKQLTDIAVEVFSLPQNLEDEKASEAIEKNGLLILLASSQCYDEVESFFSHVSFMQSLELNQIQRAEYLKGISNTTGIYSGNSFKEEAIEPEKQDVKKDSAKNAGNIEQNFISVKVSKLDLLMNLVSELVVAEAMVTRNPELEELKLDNFRKAAKQMKKIINDLQDVVMEIRMVPLAVTFLKMNRLARDMSVKTNKKIELELIGQETEVDKNIIEHISDPIMHLVRNAIDHGIENKAERERKGKDPIGKVALEAKRSGGEILIIVRDDGKGLDKAKILAKAEERDLLFKAKEEYIDEEAFELIFTPGFSTNEEITSFSGRGVGMDVVAKGIEKIGGKVQIESKKDKGTEITIRIPLTLAIVDCILVQVGEVKYAIPITSIKQLVKVKSEDIIRDPARNEMIIILNKCLKIKRLHKIHHIENAITDIEKGIVALIENNQKSVCIFVDELIGDYQLVVKSFPKYIDDVAGISGCALLGNGDICLILDPTDLIK